MTVRPRGALVTGLVPAGTAFPAGGSSGVVRWTGVEGRYGVPAPPVAGRRGVRR